MTVQSGGSSSYYSFVLHGLFARQAQNIFEQEGPEKTEAFVGSLYEGCDEPGSSCTEGFCDAMAHLGETSEYTVKKLHQLHNNYGLGISDDLEFAVAVRFED